MPLPLILGIGAAAAGLTGAGAGIRGGMKMKKANDTIKAAKKRHEENLARFEAEQSSVTSTMDSLGKMEINILKSFKDFQDNIEKIHNCPEFKSYSKERVSIPAYDKKEITKVSIGAAALLGSLGGAGAGAVGGLAAAGATTSAVMALGTASTGTAIASLSGAAATNAALATLGGGALAVGGGGMALGSLVLGGATLGVGLLVGGIIFNFTGSALSDKADEAWQQMTKAETEINKICSYLSKLKNAAVSYIDILKKVNNIYKRHLIALSESIYLHQNFLWKFFNKLKLTKKINKVNWNKFSDEQKQSIENTALLVGLLYKMCKVNLVNKPETENGMSPINKAGVENSIQEAKGLLEDKRFTV